MLLTSTVKAHDIDQDTEKGMAFNITTHNKKMTRQLKKHIKGFVKLPHRFVQKIGVITVTLFLVYGIAATQIRLVLNATTSLPHKLFVLSKRHHSSLTIPSKDRFILFYKPAIGTNVIKQVKGIPGSILSYDEQGRLWVDDFCVGKPHATSSSGKPVDAIQAGIIPPHFVFAYGSHERSFDSRYADFGLVPLDIIQGVGVAVL